MTSRREQFEVIDYNFEILMNLSGNAYEFAHMWQGYLTSCGWTEYEFEVELTRRMYSEAS